jgi:hypothetical protein
MKSENQGVGEGLLRWDTLARGQRVDTSDALQRSGVPKDQKGPELWKR